MLLAATVAQVAGQGMDAIQGYQQGKAEARVAGANAVAARANAARTRLETAQAEEAKRREVRKSLGQSAAAIAQSGIGAPGTGSAGAALKQAANEGELDAMNIRYGGETQAVAYENEALNFDYEQRAAKRRAKGAVMSGLFGSATAALSGAASYGNYKAGQKVMSARLPGKAPRTGPRKAGYNYGK